MALNTFVKCILCLVFLCLLTVKFSDAAKCSTSNTTTCDTCLNDGGCYWCGATESCHEFSFLPKECATMEWFLGTCSLAGLWLIIVIPSVGILLIIIMICCCCCYCRKNESDEEKYILAPSYRGKSNPIRRSIHGSMYDLNYHDRLMTDDDPTKYQMKKTNYGLYNDSSSNKSFS